MEPKEVKEKRLDIKNIERLDSYQRKELDKLINGLDYSLIGFEFGEVYGNENTTTLGLKLSESKFVRVTMYFGGFDMCYLSFFSSPDTIFYQDCLDIDTTIEVLNKVTKVWKTKITKQ